MKKLLAISVLSVISVLNAQATHYWTGAVSYFWNTAANWDEGTVPGSGDDVIIVAGTPYPCWVSVADQACHNLFIMGNASLRIYDEKLTVNGVMEVYGNLKMDNTSGSLWVYGDFTWNSGATATITAWAPIKVYGDMEFKSGANVQLNNGFVEFLGTGARQLICKSANSWFNTLQITNTGGIDYTANSTADLVIKNALVISSNSSLYGYCNLNTIINGSFTLATTGRYYFYSGTFVCDGGNMNLPGNAGDYFRNLTISTTGTVTLTPIHHITVNGDLKIESGVLACGDKDIYIQGDWTNLAGSSAFNEGTATVRAQGAFTQQCTNETFYDLTINKSGGYFYPGPGKTIHVTNELHISAGYLTMNTNSTLDVDGFIYILPGAYLDASQLSGINIYAGDNWFDSNSTCHFLPGTSTVTFDNPSNYLLLSVDASLYAFHNININSGGSVRMLENIGVGGDMHVIQGSWSHESYHGYNHFFYGDIIVDNTGFFRDDENVIMKNTPDQTMTLNGGTYIGNLYIDKTNDDGGKEKSLLVTVNCAPSVALNVTSLLSIDEGILDIGGSTLQVWDEMIVNNGGTFRMGPGSSLEFHADAVCNINSGGFFSSKGSAADPATVTKYYSVSYYTFNVNSGGFISSKHTIFENMDADGINVKQGSILDTGYPFDYCTFRNGAPGGALLTYNSNLDRTVANAVFPGNTWGGSSNVKRSNQTGTITFWHASGDFAGEVYDNDPYGKVNWNYDPVYAGGKIFLEGPYNGSNMNPSLNAILPLAQPYAGNPWNYNGNESVSSTPSNSIVDWLLLELRTTEGAASTANGSTFVARRAAFLSKDGLITDINGATNVSFMTGIGSSDDVYMVVYHRNHLPVMNSGPMVYSGGSYSWDYSTGVNQVFGGSLAHKNLGAGVYGMAGGDGNADGDIGNTDKNDVWVPQSGQSGYLTADFNMDTQVNNNDKNDICESRVEKIIVQCYKQLNVNNL